METRGIDQELLGQLEQYAERERRIEALEADPRRGVTQEYLRAQRFFLELDRTLRPGVSRISSGSGSSQAERRSIWVGECTRVLRRRLDRRADAYASEGRVPDLSGDALTLDFEIVGELSDVQLTIFERHFGSTGELDLEPIERAFEMFANRELILVGDGGQPNGAEYFLFAEFALLAIDHGIDAWKWLLPTFVRTQRIFMRTYRPPSEILSFANYTYESPVRKDRQFTREELLALREAYLGVEDLALEAGRNAAAAFAEDVRFRRSVRMAELTSRQ